MAKRVFVVVAVLALTLCGLLRLRHSVNLLNYQVERHLGKHNEGVVEELSHTPPALLEYERDTFNEYRTDPRRIVSNSSLHYRFEITNEDTRIDGIRRELVLINTKYPGPLIEAIEGQKITVEVINNARDPTSLHFHGYFMRYKNYLDGFSGVTQCSIKPGKSYTYEFVAEQTGTYYYHAHYGTQLMKGLVGPMVVHKNESQPDKIEKDIPVLLTDLYDKNTDDLLLEYTEPWLGGNNEPTPIISLMQGKTQPVIQVKPSRRYKLRLINASSYSRYRFSIDSHTLTVVEVDGSEVEPLETDGIEIATGQRYVVMVNTKQTSEIVGQELFWIRAGVPENEKLEVRGILNYGKGQIKANCSIPNLVLNNNSNLDESLLLNKKSIPFPLPSPDIAVTLTAGSMRDEEGVIHGTFNGTFYERRMEGAGLFDDLKIPLHHQHHHRPHEISVRGSLLATELAQVVDIVIRNEDDDGHPFHLHGHKFYVVSRGNDTYQLNYETPIFRDTVWLPRDEWVRIRFNADNPGRWMFHCHNPWHAVTGMEFELQVMLKYTHSLVKPPQEWFNLCT